MSSAGDSAKFEIIDAKLHVTIATLPTKDSANLTKQLNKWFKRPVIGIVMKRNLQKLYKKKKNLYELLNALFPNMRDWKLQHIDR